MLCNKCKTLLTKDEDVCHNCGAAAAIRRRGLSRVVVMLVLMLVLAAAGGALVLNMVVLDENESILSFIAGYFRADSPDGGDLPSSSGPDATPAPLPGASGAASYENLEQQLNVALTAIEAYVRDGSQFVPFISRMGHLFDASAQEFVTLQRLVDKGVLSENYVQVEAAILFLRPVDFMPFEEIMLSNSDRHRIFLAYDTTLGVGLISGEGRHVIFRENLNELIAGYDYRQGEVRLPLRDDWEFAAILNAVHAWVSPMEFALEARYIAINDVYAFAAISSGDDGAIRNFILRLGAGGFYVVMADFEDARQFIVDINNLLPDFYLGLLPDYDITRITLISNVHFHIIIEDMRGEGLIDEYANIVFLSGNNEFVYMIFDNEQRFLGHLTPNVGWRVEYVASFTQARELMMELSANPPFYVLRQE